MCVCVCVCNLNLRLTRSYLSKVKDKTDMLYSLTFWSLLDLSPIIKPTHLTDA